MSQISEEKILTQQEEISQQYKLSKIGTSCLTHYHASHPLTQWRASVEDGIQFFDIGKETTDQKCSWDKSMIVCDLPAFSSLLHNLPPPPTPNLGFTCSFSPFLHLLLQGKPLGLLYRGNRSGEREGQQETLLLASLVSRITWLLRIQEKCN